mmetsp:Transcript_1743/g.2643  ORF Transcript_1743/g.2643 Transcript_1743/m.2643 type:complete len:88 (+) Transcript_1743:1372-1635(+)
MSAIISSLPEPNQRALQLLFLLLHKVSKNCEKNKMSPSNLSIVFGPVLLSNPSLDPMTAMSQQNRCNSCIQHMIEDADELFLKQQPT